uniref:Uncharacterized protein n=1 Tax=Colletotrichum fructicola (strain Nara gc5) TaxID=1213859 RepID=L2GI73_COLFN
MTLLNTRKREGPSARQRTPPGQITTAIASLDRFSTAPPTTIYAQSLPLAISNIPWGPQAIGVVVFMRLNLSSKAAGGKSCGQSESRTIISRWYGPSRANQTAVPSWKEVPQRADTDTDTNTATARTEDKNKWAIVHRTATWHGGTKAHTTFAGSTSQSVVVHQHKASAKQNSGHKQSARHRTIFSRP